MWLVVFSVEGSCVSEILLLVTLTVTGLGLFLFVTFFPHLAGFCIVWRRLVAPCCFAVLHDRVGVEDVVW